jgi:glycosyltransferase involved in cell wall biosynthesis
MKIVYCIAGTYNSGGMERVLTDKANWLCDHGYDITIVTTDQKGREPFFALNDNIPCFDLKINYADNNGSSFINKLLHYPIKQCKHKRSLSKLLEKLKADIVVCMFNNDASFIYKIKDGSRKVLEIHFSKFKKLQYGRKGLWRWADKWRTKRDEKIVRHFDKFVVLTKEDASYWGSLPNITVIPNARTFETDEVSSLINKRVLAVGRLEYQKGFDTLIDIWNEVYKHTKEWRLDIVGNGSLHDNLQGKINKYKIGERTAINRDTEDIKKYYLNSSILVMTSHYEGLSMVLLEAQSFGLPIISFTCKCGPRDIITDGVDGYLIPENDNELFIQRLLDLMNDETQRKTMGKQAIASSMHFSKEKIMKRWTELFDSLSAK